MIFSVVRCSFNGERNEELTDVIPLTEEEVRELKVELGRKLFFDKRLSRDSSISCSSCHHPEWAFTDRRSVSVGVMDSLGNRNAPTLLNVVHQRTLMFDAQVPDLEQQVIVPIQDQREMNISVGDLIKRLRGIPEYEEAAIKIFNRNFDSWVLTRSLSEFERTLISENSPFDKYMHGDKDAMSQDAVKGWEIFSEKLYCTKCHPAPYFTNFIAENNGLYEDYGEDKGRFRINFDSTEIGKFKVPTLRNIELTYPYMHDGSIATLDEVIDHYSNGGKAHKNKDPDIVPFDISNEEKSQLIAFFKALTDTTYLGEFR